MDCQHIPSWIGKTVNPAGFKRITAILDRLNLRWAVNLIKKTPLDAVIRRSNMKIQKSAASRIRPQTREKLIEYYRKPNEKLSILLNRDLSAWNR